MEELKIKALVLKSVDFKDRDKILTLYSLELGLVSVILKNCNSGAYKLKFAYSTFSFCEFELLKKDEVFIVKTASLIDNFFDITSDYDKYIIGNLALELLIKTNRNFETNQILFINSLKFFNLLAYGDVDSKLILLKYLLGLTKVNGFKLNFKSCSYCNLAFVNKVFLNLDTGEFECGACKSAYSVHIENEVFSLLKRVNSVDLDDVYRVDFSESTLKDALKIILLNIEKRFNIKINSKVI